MLDTLLLSRATHHLGADAIGLSPGRHGPDVHRRVLCVDDEPLVLEGLARSLRDRYDVYRAEGGQEGLDQIRENGPFAVVISDMRMPGMDGAEFLSKVRTISPDTVRILLTGHADIDATITAVNEGQLFRFLSKPCPRDVLLTAMEGASDQFRLVRAQRDTLAQTLETAVSLLIRILSLSDPSTSYRAGTLTAYVHHMAASLDIEDAWRFDLAAMLSQIGAIAMPSETVARVRAGQSVSSEDRDRYNDHPNVGRRLLEEIPGLEVIARMIASQTIEGSGSEEDEDIRLGGAMLRLGLAIDRLTADGHSVQSAVDRLRETREHSTRLLDAMASYRGDTPRHAVKAVPPEELEPGMIMDEPLCLTGGRVLMSRGTEVTKKHVDMVQDYIGPFEPVRVRVPIRDVELAVG